MKIFSKKKSSGFTFVETILTVVIITAISGVAAKVLLTGLDVYSLIVNRHDAIQTARLSMERMVDETLLVKTINILGLTNTRFSFRDIYNNSTNFKTKTVTMDGQSVQCIYRDDDFLAGNVTFLDFDYMKADGTSTILAWQVKRVNIDINVEAPANAGTVHLRTEVFPRNFMYDNFE